MRGYCGTCKEFRSDNGLDAWSIIWKQGNPICERCDRFVDLNYFVNKGDRAQEIYPGNGSPKKHPEIARKAAKVRHLRSVCSLYNWLKT